METKDFLKQKIKDAMGKIGLEIEASQIDIERTKDPSHGDYASNVALKHAKMLQMPPRDLANKIVEVIDKEGISKIEIAGPGFINFFMETASLISVVKKIINENENYGRGIKKNQKVNIEFVSANPTGDLHVGHARGAAIGDSIARILDFDGYDVTREYYINDAGNQIDHLAESILERIKEALGLPFALPEDGYHGEDIKIIAQKIVEDIKERLPAALNEEDSLKNSKLGAWL